MYMDLYLMIRNENQTIKENKQKSKKNQSKKNQSKKINIIQLNKKDLLRDEFIKFQWPWIL